MSRVEKDQDGAVWKTRRSAMWAMGRIEDREGHEVVEVGHVDNNLPVW
jgi:hypothetical protein